MLCCSLTESNQASQAKPAKPFNKCVDGVVVNRGCTHHTQPTHKTHTKGIKTQVTTSQGTNSGMPGTPTHNKATPYPSDKVDRAHARQCSLAWPLPTLAQPIVGGIACSARVVDTQPQGGEDCGHKSLGRDSFQHY